MVGNFFKNSSILCKTGTLLSSRGFLVKHIIEVAMIFES